MRFVLCRRLFSGKFSVVHRARDMREEKDVAVKRCREPRQARKELRIVRDLADRGCRNIVRLAEDRLVGDDEIGSGEPMHEYYRQGYDHPAAIVTELCAAVPSVFATDADARDLLFDLLTALADVHAAGYIHADVKRANVLRDSRGYRLIDFGVAIERGEEADRLIRGTPFYMAPELVQGLPVTPMIDMYSAGVLAYDMLHAGEHPVEAMNWVSGERGFQAALASSAYDPKRWANPDAPLAGDLCSLLLKKYPLARLTAAEALGHPLFRGRRGFSGPRAE